MQAGAILPFIYSLLSIQNSIIPVFYIKETIIYRHNTASYIIINIKSL